MRKADYLSDIITITEPSGNIRVRAIVYNSNGKKWVKTWIIKGENNEEDKKEV